MTPAPASRGGIWAVVNLVQTAVFAIALYWVSHGGQAPPAPPPPSPAPAPAPSPSPSPIPAPVPVPVPVPAPRPSPQNPFSDGVGQLLRAYEVAFSTASIDVAKGRDAGLTETLMKIEAARSAPRKALGEAIDHAMSPHIDVNGRYADPAAAATVLRKVSEAFRDLTR